MRVKIFLLSGVLVIEIVNFFRWSSCWQLIDSFYFNNIILHTQLLIATNEEKGLPLLLIRLLHNKPIGWAWGIPETLLQYFDIRFLMELVSIVGAIGVYLGLWYFFTKKAKFVPLWILFMGLILLCCFEMIVTSHIPLQKRIIPMDILFASLSLFGVWQFLKSGNRLIRPLLIATCIIISLCAIFLFPHSLFSICLRV